MAKAKGIKGLPQGTQTRRDNATQFVGRTIVGPAATTLAWPAHCKASGDASAKVLADAGPKGMTFGEYVALKGSVSRLCYMVQKGVATVQATAETTRAPNQHG